MRAISAVHGRLAAAGLFIAALAVLAGGCSTAAVPLPEGALEMVARGDSEEVILRSFPGHKGVFFSMPHLPGVPVMGVVTNPKDRSKCYLTGAREKRNWWVEIPLEADRRVTAVNTRTMATADLRKDGTNEVFVVLDVTSEPRSGEGKQKRTALYVYELDQRASLMWYRTIFLEGDRTDACGEGELRYSVGVDYVTDEQQRLDAIEVTYDKVSLSCTGGAGCGEALECERTREEGTDRLEWDPGLRTFRPKGDKETVLKIPDVSL